MINQLRIYEVPAANRQPFLDRFHDHAARLMADYGFRIQAMWMSEIEVNPKFVYLLIWDDEDQMRTAWDGFMVDPEWAQIKQETRAAHGDFVLGIDDLVLTPTAFSSALGDDQ